MLSKVRATKKRLKGSKRKQENEERRDEEMEMGKSLNTIEAHTTNSTQHFPKTTPAEDQSNLQANYSLFSPINSSLQRHITSNQTFQSGCQIA
jgi:hypothetical protein